MSKQPQLCDLPGKGKTHGLCCFTKQNHTSKDFFSKHGKLRTSDRHIMDSVIREAKVELKMLRNSEKKAAAVTGRSFEPDFFHQMVFG
jgi:hypothetical protein